jgi:DnaK suppressor protein
MNEAGRETRKVMVAKAKTAKAASKTASKPAKVAARKPAAKPAAKAAPKAAPKGASKIPVKAAPKPAAAPARGREAAKPAVPRVASAAAVAARPAPAPKMPIPASPKEVAAAHEYLLTRSANRSEEPIEVNGRRLPTEEQLLKMPDSAYMNEDQLAFFKHRLQLMEQELLANAGETTEHLRETVIVPDPADRATIEEEHALELRTRDRERKLLKKVQSALQRIDGGDYGYCEETGDPIGIPRLLARPTATLSLEAQQRRELKQKLFGD